MKPVKPIKAPSQYKPPLEGTNLETSYSATFKGEQVKPHPFDNKSLERRRIRSLYSEPGKEPAKVRTVPPATISNSVCATVLYKSQCFLDKTAGPNGDET